MGKRNVLILVLLIAAEVCQFVLGIAAMAHRFNADLAVMISLSGLLKLGAIYLAWVSLVEMQRSIHQRLITTQSATRQF